MNKNQIIVHKNTLDAIANKIEDTMDIQQLKQAISWEQVKISAKEYLIIIENLNKSIQNFQLKLKKMKDLRHSFPENAYKALPQYINLSKSISYFLNGYKPDIIYKSTINFQKIINSKLGQQLQSIVVFQNQEGNPVISNFHISDSLKYNYSSTGKLNAAINISKKNQQILQDIEQHMLKDNQVSYLQFLYQDMNSRYDIGQETGSHRIMWKNPFPPPKWKKRKLQSKGSLNEAYASLLLERRYQRYFSDYRIDVDRFMQQEINRVDNISGVLQGDAQYQGIQYVIKSLNASFMGLNDIINIAKKIVGQSQLNILQDLLKNEKEQLANKGHQINAVSQQALKKEITKSFQSLEKEKYYIAMKILGS